MHDDSCRCINGKRCRIGNRMCRTDELNAKRTECDHLSVCNNLSTYIVDISMFTKLMLDQSHRQLRCIDRHIHLILNIWYRSDMVLMSVRNYKSLDLICVLLQVCDIRDNEINSEHLILRKCESTIHDNNTVLILKRGNVHSDLL